MPINKKYIIIPNDIKFLDPVSDKPVVRVNNEGKVVGELEPYTFKQFLVQMLKNPMFLREGVENLAIACNIMNAYRNPDGSLMTLAIDEYQKLSEAIKKPKYEFNGREFTDYGLPAEALTPQIMPFISAVLYKAKDESP